MLFDIIISSIEKDKSYFQHTIKNIKKYVKNYRRIIVVSNNKLTDIEGVNGLMKKNILLQKKMYLIIYIILVKNVIKNDINQLLKLYLL